jgi:hypothetical protein
MKTILQLYPNEDVFGFEHGDEFVYWVAVNDNQKSIITAINWLMCSEIDVHENIDYDISNGGIGEALNVLNQILTDLN